MRKGLILLTAFSLLTPVATSGVSAGPLRDRIKARMAQRFEDKAAREPRAVGGTEYAYGADPLQKLDFWAAKDKGAPLVLFVHGGGWKRGDKRNATGPFKAPHYVDEGYAFASINYRLVPAHSVEEQARDVAHAIAYVIAHADRLGIDPRRIILMGHSAGAHLVALVGTDIRYLAGAGLGADAVRGVIPLDGTCYDVPRQIAEGGRFMHETYVQAFGTDPVRQRALSPTFHAGADNAPAFLILHVARKDSSAQADALGAALRAAGTPAEVTGLDGRGLKGHMDINRRLGDPGYAATPVVDQWLARHFAP